MVAMITAIKVISITMMMRTMKINALTLDGLEIPRGRLVREAVIYVLADFAR